MAYDDVILRMGEFGRYQRRIYLLLCIPAISCAFHKMAGVFLGAKMNTRCVLPFENGDNVTYETPFMNTSYPWDYETKAWSQCERLVVDLALNLTRLNASESGGGGGQDSGGGIMSDLARKSIEQNTVPCERYVFDTSVYQSTTTSEWNLVCERGWLRATGDSLFMVGVMLGSMIFGGLSDKFGRRPIFFLSLVIQLVGGILVAVAPEYISYVIFRLIVGSTTSGVFLVAYVIGVKQALPVVYCQLFWSQGGRTVPSDLVFSCEFFCTQMFSALEMVGPKKRLVAGVGCQLFFTTGYIITAGFAYLLTDWRTLQIGITVPSIAFLVYWWFIPESARWLLTKGKVEEAKDLLHHAAKENGANLSRETLDSLLNDTTGGASAPDLNKPSLLDLFRYPNLRRKTILLFFNWLVNSGTYYGLSWNAASLGGNDYVNFVISGIVEVPAYTFLIFTLDRWGRKMILCGCMVVSGSALLATLFVPPSSTWVFFGLAMIGKLAITSSYGAIYVFTAEQFPTVVRNVGLGASSTFARIGGVIAPYINHLSEIWTPFPLVIFGTCALVGGSLSLLLPETLNKKLPESIQDGELFGKKETSIEKEKRKRRRQQQQLDVEVLTEIESIKPLKAQENGVHDRKQNG